MVDGVGFGVRVGVIVVVVNALENATWRQEHAKVMRLA